MLTRNHTQLAATVAEHIAADAVSQGDYWDAETQRGCFIGCLAHDDNPDAIEATYGIPVMLTRIAENIFEALPADEAREFFAAFPAAVGRDGKDLSRVCWRFLAQVLRELPPQPTAPQEVTDAVIAGLDLLANGQPWLAAAAYAAADAAAWADATAAADAAARADAAAAAAARAAARAAAYAAAAAKARAAAGAAAAAKAPTVRRQRDLLLHLLREAQ